MIRCYIASWYKACPQLDTTRIIKSRGRVRKTAAVLIAVYTLPFMAVRIPVFAQKSKPPTAIWITIETYSSNDINLQM